MKSKTGYIIGTLKKRNESLCQENDKLKDEIERLNVELSEAVKINESLVRNDQYNQNIKTEMSKQIGNLSNKLNTTINIQTDTENLLRRAIQSNVDANADVAKQTSEANMWKNKFTKLNTYVRNVGITIVIFGVIILFTQYM